MADGAARGGACRAILFDKDGTLFDFQRSWGDWAAAELARLARGDAVRLAALDDAILFDRAARRFAPSSPAIAGTPREIAAILGPVLGTPDIEALAAELGDSAAAAPMHPAVPLAPLLDELRAAGLRLGVATNDAERAARSHLAAAGVLGRFDAVLGYDSGHGAKPGPGMCLGFAGLLGLDPAACVMVGDSLHDLAAARAAGMTAVAVLTGPARAETLAPHADAVLADIGKLPRWLARAQQETCR